jgi:hypothetical protein
MAMPMTYLESTGEDAARSQSCAEKSQNVDAVDKAVEIKAVDT